MPATTKAAWRQTFRERRAALDDDAYGAATDALTRRLLDLPEVAAARHILGYWPMVARREVDTRPFLRQMLAQKKQIVLPVVVSFDRHLTQHPRLQLVPLQQEADLRPNRWGILEPPMVEEVSANSLDLILVPALGVDQQGYRIGHGYGYYDQLLSQTAAPTVCPTYTTCLVERLPRDLHDRPVRVIVTEDAVLRIAAS